MSSLALELIAKEKKEKTGRIDLSNCNLTTLPDELFELVHLKELILDNHYWDSRTEQWINSTNHEMANRLLELPIKIKELKNLTSLFIGCNQSIQNLTLLGELKHLHTLDLSDNKITDASFLANLTVLNTLDLSNNQITDASFLAYLSGLQTLYISNNQITNASFLANLTALHTLDLSNNQITNASFLMALTKLKTLVLINNQILDTRPFQKLIELQTLDLSFNKISDASSLAKLRGLRSLYLSFNPIIDYSHLSTLARLENLGLTNNKIEDISFLSSLTNLKHLILNVNQITDISSLDTLTKVQTLNLSSNEILDVKSLAKLMELKTLDLSSNQISDARPLASLEKLHNLNLTNNQISDVSPLAKLTELKTLNLSSNEILDVKSLAKLTGLQTLHLSTNQISDVNPLVKLTGLQTLDLSTNQISDVTPLAKLTELTTLNLSSNQISDISPLANLTKLQTLIVSDNQISDISSLKELTGLQNLFLDFNKISNINSSIATGLNVLSISNNQISDASFLSKITRLHSLYLNGNQISDLNFLTKLTGLQNLYIADNPIYYDIPAEIKNEGASIIIEWVRNQVINTKKISLHQAKVLLLGNTNVGKSFLLYFLENEQLPQESESTFGLVYKVLEKFNKTLHIYDFGGQEYFHATHKLFFSEDALHLLLWSKENEQRQGQMDACFELDYWLRCIQQLAKGTQNEGSIETLLVENKIDKQNGLPTLIDFESLQPKFKELKINHIAISLLEKKRLKGLVELIEERIEALPALQENYTQPYQDVIDKIISNRHSGKLVISPDKLLNQYTRNSMKVFHNLGLVLYYPEVLSDKVFIQPKAFLDLLYKNILHENAKNSNGKLSLKAIEKAIKENSLGLQLDEIISLLKYFDIIFKVKNDSDVYFAPQYLPDKSSSMLDLFASYYFKKAVLRVESDSYLLNLVMLKIFGEYGKNVKGENEYLFWRDGIVIEKNQRLLYIQYNREKHHIDLYGDIENKNWPLQQEVVDFILTIPVKEGDHHIEAIKDKGALREEFVAPKISKISNRDKIEGIKLKGALREEFIRHHEIYGEHIDPEISKILSWEENEYFLISVSINGEQFALWKDIQTTKLPHFVSRGDNFNLKDFRFYLKNDKIMKKIFISYSKDDLSLVNEFLKNLTSLERAGTVSSWYCTQLLAGSEWDEKIQQEFDSSDIVCFMVSPNFMATDYIYNYELKKAIDRKKKEPNFKIVPIILNYCLWTSEDEYNLGKYTALPYTNSNFL